MKAGDRVVVDTNTIISGILLPESVPGKLLGFLAEHATLIFSPATRDELLDVIGEFEGIPIRTPARCLADIR